MNLKFLKTQLNNRIEDVLSRLDIQHETLGDNVYCCCPIHSESDNPRAFSFSKSKGIWRCWTRDCQNEYKNDIFGLLQGGLSKKNGVDQSFSDVIKWCNNFLNIKEIKYEKQTEQQEDDFSKLVHTINQKTHIIEDPKELKILENIETPSEYFLSRGFNPETLKVFGVGDCYDKKSKFFERSIVPIHNDNGDKLIACTARAIKEYKSPKFILYPKGFEKRFFFYNYHRAINEVRKSSTLILVEGQSDVWRLYETGIHQVMGIFGRILSKEQETKINKMPVTHIVVLVDNDQSGRESKIQIQRQLSRMYKLSFPKIPTKDIGEMSVDEIKNILLPQIKIKGTNA
jgi:DNA primase